jgi:hypothetical protein
MAADAGNEESEERESRRPRVVDKRVSTRPPDEKPPEAEAPAGAGEAPPKEPIVTPPPQAAEPPPQTSEPSRPTPTQPDAGPPPGAPGDRVWTPEEEAEARRAAQEMASVPGRDWVLNVAVTLANVAGIKLQEGQLEDAHLAIDAFSGMIDKIESQMGDAGPVLRQTLAQLQMAYAQAVTPPPQPAE